MSPTKVYLHDIQVAGQLQVVFAQLRVAIYLLQGSTQLLIGLLVGAAGMVQDHHLRNVTGFKGDMVE